MKKKTRKNAAWTFIILMLLSVAASILAYIAS